MPLGGMLGQLTVILGAFGSGKSEIAINAGLAAAERPPGPSGLRRVVLADLDSVTPAVRLREAAAALAAAGVELIAPLGELAYADLPTVPESLADAVLDPAAVVIIDAGGHPAGARVIGSLAGLITKDDLRCWIVVSPLRPETSDPESVARMVEDLAGSARLSPDGLVANLHLGKDGSRTGDPAWLRAFQVVSDGAVRAGLPVLLATVDGQYLFDVRAALPADVTVAGLDLHLRPPWDLDE